MALDTLLARFGGDSLPRRRTRLVLSVSAGKDLGAILRVLLPAASEVTLSEHFNIVEPARCV